MAHYEFRLPRLYLDTPLGTGGSIPLDPGRTNYLVNVLRFKPGDAVLAFNGREGEWRASLERAGKRAVALRIGERTRAQTPPGDLHYLFAPLKHARLDYMVQKAVELGVSHLAPVLTRHAQVARVNLERMRANSIEAAEQCGILTLPSIAEPVTLEDALGALAPERALVFCDEDAERQDPLAALSALRRGAMPLAVLIGPEGGFAAEERAMLLAHANVTRLSLGPRILRADTAAVAALTLVQSVLGDWG